MLIRWPRLKFAWFARRGWFAPDIFPIYRRACCSVVEHITVVFVAGWEAVPTTRHMLDLICSIYDRRKGFVEGPKWFPYARALIATAHLQVAIGFVSEGEKMKRRMLTRNHVLWNPPTLKFVSIVLAVPWFCPRYARLKRLTSAHRQPKNCQCSLYILYMLINIVS